MNKRVLFIILILIVILTNSLSRSVLLMSISNYINIKDSFLENANIKIQIPDENQLNWYPLMNVFYPRNFSNYVKRDVDLLIFYTFGNFDRSYSNIFNKSSQTFSSYYGAYVLQVNDNQPFLISQNNQFIKEDLVNIVKFDYKKLVLDHLGYNDEIIFDYNILSIEHEETKIKLKAEIFMNSLEHNYKNFNYNYLQYGFPPKNHTESEFNPINTYGKFIIENSTEYNNIFYIYYIVNQDQELVFSFGD